MYARSLLFCLILCSSFSLSSGQPLFETRAIWLTTALGLDWPSTGAGASSQEARLKQLIVRARQKGLNTVFFQVVTRGDAFYQSDRLPWSGILTGSTGVDPGFDPLRVAIETAHEQGMELHAWINTYRIAKATTGASGPNHVTEDHPEWTELDGAWLNPGYPGVNDWLVDNVAELVDRYDVDAVHFDFARYNQGGYIRDDSLYLATNPSGIATKNDWRRENVNNLMREIQSVVSSIKSWVKIGSTPIGNYDESCFPGALTGFNNVFQDSRLWLSEGVNDYLAPQLYWADSNTSSPSFTCLVKDWVAGNPSSRHLYPGVALYVPDVAAELGAQIDVTRNEGTQGVSFFREAFTRSEDFEGRFDMLSLQPPVSLRFEAQAPETPDSVSVAVDAPNLVHIEWTPSAGSTFDPLGWYAIFRKSGSAPNTEDAADLVAVVFRDKVSFDDMLPEGEVGPVFYSIVAISRLGFLADPTPPISSGALNVGIESEIPSGPLSIDAVFPNPSLGRFVVQYTSDRPRDTELNVIDERGRIALARSIRSTTGTNTYVVKDQDLAPGLYLVTLTTGASRVTSTIVLAQ